MPIPFDMLAVMLFLGYYAETPVARAPSPGQAVAVLGLGAALLLAAAALINHVALRFLRRPGVIPAERRRRAGAAELLLRVLTVAVYILVLEESALPWSLAAALGKRPEGGSFLAQLLGLVPYLVLFFCAWLPMYGLHRATSYGVWTRSGFLLHKARYNLFVLLAWLPFALLAEWLSGFVVALPFLFLLAAWSFPYILARAWGCTPLPNGEVRDRVRRLEERTGTRFSRIYLWEPGGGGTQNAAAVGVFRPFRYLFLTPALIRNMDDDQLDAVILHELGHVKKRHLLFYLVTSLAGINVAVLVGALLPLAGTGERFVVTTALVIGYFRLVFGWLSRNMERQADLFALETTGSAGGLANALEKLGLSAGNIRLAASWHHMGIAERVAFLRRAERRPELVRRHNAGVNAIMAAGYALSLSAIVLFGYAVFAEYAAPSAPAVSTAAEEEAHWRRVMLVMPGNPNAPLELAYRLAARPETRGEAAGMAAKALRMSREGEHRAAAEKLLGELDGGTETANTPEKP